MQVSILESGEQTWKEEREEKDEIQVSIFKNLLSRIAVHKHFDLSSLSWNKSCLNTSTLGSSLSSNKRI